MTFVLNRHRIIWLAAWAVVCLVVQPAGRADVVAGGQLTFNLDGDAFAHGADVDFLASFGVIYNPNQTFMEFAKHGSNALAGRPAPSSGPGSVTDFRDIRDTWSRPSSTGLLYGFNTNMALQTLQFNAGTIQTSGATGNIRFLGGDSFWYGNDPIIDTGSIWLQYGNMDLTYDANRVGGGNSGWYFRNNVLAPLEIFDVRNVVIDASPGVLNISGDLYTAPEFRDNPSMPFFIKSGMNVGTFSFNGFTAVPEPSSGLLTAMAVGSVFVRRRRRQG
ncbi:MAG: PEP-CTERM sorting domain-containing protein [Planctomycetaceae bacterium]|nr:PEP-CTERM sorting domain-containing protein [Planctomycetaceae bacterium]